MRPANATSPRDYALNLQLEAMRSRAGTAEKLLTEVRQNLTARTEEIRSSERKTVEATIARNSTEKTVEAAHRRP